MHTRSLRLVLPLLAVGLAMGGCTIGETTVQGSGHVKSEQRSVSGFNAVTFSGVGQLTITQTGKDSLTVKADDNLLPLLTSTVSGGTLELGIKPNSSIQSATTITFDVTVKELKEITLSGAGSATVTNLNTPALTVTVSGTGHLTVSGSADSQQVTISGVGSYDGSGFATKTAKVSISGTGNAVVQVSDSLDADVSGVGSVEYIGNPRVTQHVTGLGSVRQR
jgi:putative autotransporter adhesin-like protein